jgi:hypothetical protein
LNKIIYPWGFSFHFSGSLRNAEDLPSLIEEIVDVSRVYDWKYNIYNSNFPNDTFEKQESFENVYGINFTPTNCEAHTRFESRQIITLNNYVHTNRHPNPRIRPVY